MNTYTIQSIDAQTGEIAVEFNFNGSKVTRKIMNLTVNNDEVFHEEVSQWGRDYLKGVEDIKPPIVSNGILAKIGVPQAIL